MTSTPERGIAALLAAMAKIALLLLQSSVIVAGFLWLRPAELFRNPDLARIVVFHVPCSIVAVLASTVATWYALRYLRFRLPVDDIKSRVSFALALLLWVLTTTTGAVFAQVQWGSPWNWDIKQTCILMLLLIDTAYFALRAAIDNPHKQATLAAVYSIFAVIATIFLTYVLPNSTDDTLHPKKVLTSNTGLDPSYKLVLWAGVFCLSMVYVWAFRIQVKFEQLVLVAGRSQANVPRVMITEGS